jgi:hypothetical protein
MNASSGYGRLIFDVGYWMFRVLISPQITQIHTNVFFCADLCSSVCGNAQQDGSKKLRNCKSKVVSLPIVDEFGGVDVLPVMADFEVEVRAGRFSGRPDRRNHIVFRDLLFFRHL